VILLCSKNDRYRAERDNIARAPRGEKKEKRGETARSFTQQTEVHIESEHIRMHAMLLHSQNTTMIDSKLHPSWIKQQRVPNILHDTPFFFSTLILISVSSHCSQPVDPYKKVVLLVHKNQVAMGVS